MAAAIIRTPQEAPDIAAARSLALEAAGIIAPELHRPPSHRLVRDDNAALQQHLLDQAKAQREANRVCNHSVTGAPHLAPELRSDPALASPDCTGVHSRARLYIESCAENGVPERT